MTTLYKLTNADMTTHGGCKWGDGVEHRTSGEGELCGPGWLHAYTDPLLAVLLNPIHGNFGPGMILWEAEGDVGKTDHGLKVGCRRLRTVRRIPVPEVTIIQRVAFGILCALELPQSEEFKLWAGDWLSGKDRSASTTAAVAVAVYEVAAAAVKIDLSAIARKAMEIK